MLGSDGSPSIFFSNQTVANFRYYYYDVWQQTGDPRINNFPMMEGGPWNVLTIIAAYVAFVKAIGPALMADRKPFSLKPVIFSYNVFMVLINALFFLYASYHTNFGIKTWQCNPVDKNKFDTEWQIKLTVSWLFVMSKFVDLLDTVFFVLRKNYHQVSALHVIHHSLVPINCWLGLKYVPSESAAFMRKLLRLSLSVCLTTHPLSPHSIHQQLYSRSHVHVLRYVITRSRSQTVPVVEEVPDEHANHPIGPRDSSLCLLGTQLCLQSAPSTLLGGHSSSVTLLVHVLQLLHSLVH